MEKRSELRQLNVLLWLLVTVPLFVMVTTHLTGQIVIWYIRLIDLADLVVLAPFFLVVLLALQKLILGELSDKRMWWISGILIGVFMYGHAMHLTANTINTYSTEVRSYGDQIPPDTYELIYFFDESLGHWLAYAALYLLLGVYIVNSEINGNARSAGLAGALMGLSYAIAFIESSQPWMGFAAAGWLLGCASWSAHRRSINLRGLWDSHPLVAFGLVHGLSLVIGELMYAAVVGGFTEPSRLGVV